MNLITLVVYHHVSNKYADVIASLAIARVLEVQNADDLYVPWWILSDQKILFIYITVNYN